MSSTSGTKKEFGIEQRDEAGEDSDPPTTEQLNMRCTGQLVS